MSKNLTSFPPVDHADIARLLQLPDGPCEVLIDTDTYNEIDDQFAIVHAVLSEQVRVNSIQAAPFHAEVRKTTDHEHGMELSYAEIHRVLERLPGVFDGPVLAGARTTITASGGPVKSPAVDNLVEQATAERDAPLYVLALGASTNIASALLLAPEIRSRIVVVALGGWPYQAPGFREFNFSQDIRAAQTLFNSGVALVHVPGFSVAEMLRTTRWEMAQYVKGCGAIGDYLYELYEEFVPDVPGRSKAIWDLAPVAFLLNASWLRTHLVASPVLGDNLLYGQDPNRHPVRVTSWINRDAVYTDFFATLQQATIGATSS